MSQNPGRKQLDICKRDSNWWSIFHFHTRYGFKGLITPASALLTGKQASRHSSINQLYIYSQVPLNTFSTGVRILNAVFIHTANIGTDLTMPNHENLEWLGKRPVEEFGYERPNLSLGPLQHITPYPKVLVIKQIYPQNPLSLRLSAKGSFKQVIYPSKALQGSKYFPWLSR